MNSEIPRQAGLAGSTALLSAIMGVVIKALGKDYSPHYFAEVNRIIELRYMKTHCGYQDAYMTSFGGLNFLDFRGKAYYRNLNEEIYASVERLSVKNLPFILAHTGIKHNSGDFHKPLRERWLEGEKEVVEAYQEIVEIALKGKRDLLDGNWDLLGRLMNENHRIQDSLSYSGEQNNELIEAVLAEGTLGAKLAGAGGGGTIIALTLDEERTRKALLEAGAEMVLGLDAGAEGISIVDERVEDEVAAAGE